MMVSVNVQRANSNVVQHSEVKGGVHRDRQGLQHMGAPPPQGQQEEVGRVWQGDFGGEL